MKAIVKATGQIIDVHWVGMDMLTRDNMYVGGNKVRYTGSELKVPSKKEIWDARDK